VRWYWWTSASYKPDFSKKSGLCPNQYGDYYLSKYINSIVFQSLKSYLFPSIYLIAIAAIDGAFNILPVQAIDPNPIINYQNTPNSTNKALLNSAQNLNRKGAEYLATGQAKLALASWQQAHKIYLGLKDKEGIIGTEINQAQALQSLGLYRQALSVLRSTRTQLQSQPNSALKIRGLLSLGNTLKSLRVLNIPANKSRLDIDFGATEILTQALKLAIDLQDPGLANQIELSLANTLELIGDPDTKQAAIQIYQSVAAKSNSPVLRIQAQINSYRLNPRNDLNSSIFLTNIRKELDLITPSRSTVYTYVALAKTIQKSQADKTINRALSLQISSLLTTAISQARTLGDARGEAQAVGTLGNLYQLVGQDQDAQKLTEQALVIAESLPAPDLAYRLQWQLGKILTVTKPQNPQPAITAYQQAVRHLKTLRNDLNASDADLQFSFRDSVEPVYRELVDLLLRNDDKVLTTNLTAARDLIESLQVAELENYLRQGCLDTYTVELAKIDRSAVVIYPIILRDRVAVIAAVPNQPLRYYSRSISEINLKNIITKLREQLDNSEFTATQEQLFQQQSQQVYNLIIAPLAKDLATSNSKTLVFVLDGVLRNIPMSMLYDGKKYLVESYNLALTPGLQLVPPPSDNNRQQYQALLGGISEERQGFKSLTGVKQELAMISNLMPSQQLINADFNQSQFSTKLVADRSSIVHLATHGEFSSDPTKTFILTWDRRLDLARLNNLLQNRNLQSNQGIDLLVLSACETATGDNRATLGLAGVAIKARTKSTIASLWKVNDKATQLLMTNFYQNLVTKKLGKAESLKLAQQSLLQQSQYRSPYYWAAFVLVGNWQ
jgi:CHAT domain-containing protein